MSDFELFPGFKIKVIKPLSWLWFRYLWCRFVLRRPIQGFLNGIPIFLDENLEEEK